MILFDGKELTRELDKIRADVHRAYLSGIACTTRLTYPFLQIFWSSTAGLPALARGRPRRGWLVL
jgi:hypothetical protein